MTDLAQTAHEIAVRAETKIDSHEVQCTERYNTLNNTMDEIKQDSRDHNEKMNRNLEKIYSRQWSWAMAFILLLIGAVAGLAGYVLVEADQRIDRIEHHD